MPGPYRKVERITVYGELQLVAVLRLSGVRPVDYSINDISNRLDSVGSWHDARFSVFKDFEGIYTVLYTPGELGMRSTSKTVLYTITGVGATSKRVPVGIFANEDKCKPYAVHVMIQAKAGNAAALKELGLDHLVTESGEVAKGLRFQRLTLPYEPEFAASDVDPFAEAKPDAS